MINVAEKTVYRDKVNYLVVSGMRDIFEAKKYDGNTLSNVEIIGAVYNDAGSESEWSISNDSLYNSGGSSWKLILSEVESTQTESYGTITIVADEIEPHQIGVKFRKYVQAGNQSMTVSVSVGI
jgi:hypothetical protein